VTLFDPILHFFGYSSPPSVCVPNLKFLASTIRGILGVPKLKNWVTWLPHDHFWPNFECFSLELTAVRHLAKFEDSSFNRSRDIKGVQQFQNWVIWPPHDPFRPNFAFFSLELTAIRLGAKFEVFSFNRSRDIRGSKISKLGHVTLPWPRLTQFWMFFVRTHRRPSPCQIWSF